MDGRADLDEPTLTQKAGPSDIVRFRLVSMTPDAFELKNWSLSMKHAFNQANTLKSQYRRVEHVSRAVLTM
jgi:hypothetical protein